MAPVAQRVEGNRPITSEPAPILRARLQARRSEIEEATVNRVYAISDPTETADPSYISGLGTALGAALDYGFRGVGSSEEDSPEIPPMLFVQARAAARIGVSLDTVLRRYFAGYTLLSDFIIEEAERDELLGAAELKRLLRIQASLFDNLITAVSEEYVRAGHGRTQTKDQRIGERVERLIAGELIDTTEFSYDLDAHHIGAIAVGPGAAEAAKSMAQALGCRRLVVPRDDKTVWVWFGGRHRIDIEALERHLSEQWPPHISLVLGEPSHTFAGWRLTHQQARAALPIAMESPFSLTRYADVALLASVRQDQLLVTSLRLFYLAPLEQTPDGGLVLRETLRAYFASGRNVSSAAAKLKVNRRTVTNRIHAVEECIGRPFEDCAVDLQMALQLDEFVN